MSGMKWKLAALVAIALGACGGGAEPHMVGGTVVGTKGGAVVLQLVGGDMLQEATAKGDGSFAFPLPIAGEYVVLVDSAPLGLACTLSDSQGAETHSDATAVACTETSFNVGGSIASDPDIGDALVELRNTVNGETITLANSGDFTFTQPVPAGARYNVIVSSQSAGLGCTVANGSGAASDEVGDIAVTCTAGVSAVAPRLLTASEGQPSTGFPPAGLKAVFRNQFIFVTWDAFPPSTYRLFEDIDGLGPAASVHINDASTKINGTLTTGNRDYVILADPAHVLLTHPRARYSVQSCYKDVCSRVSAQVGIDFTEIPNYVVALDNALAASDKLIRSLDAQYRENQGLYAKLRYEFDITRDYRLIRRIDNELPANAAVIVKKRTRAFEAMRTLYDMRMGFREGCRYIPNCYPILLAPQPPW